MRKADQRKMSHQRMIALLALLTVAVLLLMTGCASRGSNAQGGDEDTVPSDSASGEWTEFTTVPLGSGINVVAISRYAGFYVEDGSDEIVSDIPVITVENTGSDAVQFMNFTLTAASGTEYEFELTTLLPGEKMTVLEKNRAVMEAGTAIASASVNAYAVFNEIPSLHTEIFDLTCSDNKLIVKNISDKTVSAGKIFYKNMSGDLLVGGITYMNSFSDLAPGEEIALAPAHFMDGKSRIIFVTYAE